METGKCWDAGYGDAALTFLTVLIRLPSLVKSLCINYGATEKSSVCCQQGSIYNIPDRRRHSSAGRRGRSRRDMLTQRHRDSIAVSVVVDKTRINDSEHFSIRKRD